MTPRNPSGVTLRPHQCIREVGIFFVTVCINLFLLTELYLLLVAHSYTRPFGALPNMLWFLPLQRLGVIAHSCLISGF